MWPTAQQFAGIDAMTAFSINETPFFVTALDNGTTTGVLRQHVIRLDSSSKCDYIAAEDFPTLSLCPGERPFELSYNYSTSLDVAVCATGNYGVSPWSLSRDRQDISEDFFMNVNAHSSSMTADPLQFTVHCEVNTTRGYFEVGNIHNGYAYGPLLETWPDVLDMETNFNDAIPTKLAYPGGLIQGWVSFDSDPVAYWSGTPPSAL